MTLLVHHSTEQTSITVGFEEIWVFAIYGICQFAGINLLALSSSATDVKCNQNILSESEQCKFQVSQWADWGGQCMQFAIC